MPDLARPVLQTITITCVKCKGQITLHQPMLDMHVAPASTVYVLSPAWSLDERICPRCGAVYAPLLRLQLHPGAGPYIDWTVIQQQEPSKIVLPKMVMPGRG